MREDGRELEVITKRGVSPLLNIPFEPGWGPAV